MSQTLAIDAAFKAGDLAALKRLVTDAERFPDTLSDLGDGFPPVIALMSCLTDTDHRRHGDGIDVLDLLIAHGANPLLKTRIDDLETPREVAIAAGHRQAAARLLQAEHTVKGSD